MTCSWIVTRPGYWGNPRTLGNKICQENVRENPEYNEKAMEKPCAVEKKIIIASLKSETASPPTNIRETRRWCPGNQGNMSGNLKIGVLWHPCAQVRRRTEKKMMRFWAFYRPPLSSRFSESSKAILSLTVRPTSLKLALNSMLTLTNNKLQLTFWFLAFLLHCSLSITDVD